MKKFIVAGIVFMLTGICCFFAVVGVCIAKLPSPEERLLEQYEEAVKSGDLERVLEINGMEGQGVFKQYSEEDIPYLGMKPNMILGNRKSGNDGENGSLEYVVVYSEDGELKYRVECDDVIKSDDRMYLLHW